MEGCGSTLQSALHQHMSVRRENAVVAKTIAKIDTDCQWSFVLVAENWLVVGSGFLFSCFHAVALFQSLACPDCLASSSHLQKGGGSDWTFRIQLAAEDD